MTDLENEKAGFNAFAELDQRIRAFWEAESADWDMMIDGEAEPSEQAGELDLWGMMPAVDSKATARTAPIFNDVLGITLDVNLIRPGGYDSIDEMIEHLVPAMIDKAEATLNG